MMGNFLPLLAGYPAATVDEAQARVGALPAAIKPVDPRSRICAPAYCVRTTPGNNLMLHRAIYAAPAGSVLVIDVGGPDGYEFGYWGDVMTVAASERGLAGVVIDGGARDADASSPLRQRLPRWSHRRRRNGRTRNQRSWSACARAKPRWLFSVFEKAPAL
jgi:regulator of RNase E activity RraA